MKTVNFSFNIDHAVASLATHHESTIARRDTLINIFNKILTDFKFLSLTNSLENLQQSYH